MTNNGHGIVNGLEMAMVDKYVGECKDGKYHGRELILVQNGENM